MSWVEGIRPLLRGPDSAGWTETDHVVRLADHAGIGNFRRARILLLHAVELEAVATVEGHRTWIVLCDPQHGRSVSCGGVKQCLSHPSAVMGRGHIEAEQLAVAGKFLITGAKTGPRHREPYDLLLVVLGDPDAPIPAGVSENVFPHPLAPLDMPFRKEDLRKQMRVRLPPGLNVQFGDVSRVGEGGLAQGERHHHMVPEPLCHDATPQTGGPVLT